MDGGTLLIMFITLLLAGVFLWVWGRRDRGHDPVDHLPDALHEPLNGREAA